MQLKPVAHIGFLLEVLPAPATTQGTEEHKNEGAQGEKVVAHDEVFEVKHAGAGPKGLEVAEHAVAQGTGKRQYPQEHAVDDVGCTP